MGLDITLRVKGTKNKRYSSGIFIRENGQNKEISEEEWNARFPDRQPVRIAEEFLNELTDEVYSNHITHNLVEMAEHAGLYYALWRPEEKGWKRAKDILKILRGGLEELKTKPDEFKFYNPDNGWGDYDTFVKFVQDYLRACEQFPEAEIEVSR